MKSKYIIPVVALLAAVSINAQNAFAQGRQAGDAGVEAVREAQAAPVPQKPADAFKVLRDIARQRNWREGWDDEKKRYIVIESADFKIIDPATDTGFFTKRELAAKKAVLSAKVSIIQSIRQEMSATDLVDMPGSDVNQALGADREKINAELAAQAGVVQSLLNEKDRAEADALKGATTGDRLNSVLDALIKKLDVEYDANAKDAQKQSALKTASDNLKAEKAKYAELQKKAEAMQAEVRERQESAVESMSKMPLYGATVIMQTESWDKNSGKYQVAVMLCWSFSMERSARAIVTGEDYKIKPDKDAKTINEWLDSQNLATMVGPRQYIDNQGNRWFLGITARPYGDDLSSTERRKNKGLSEMFAQQMAVFSVFADVESYKLAKTALESRGNAKEQRDVVAESYAEKLTQSFQNKIVRGLTRLATQEVAHPITGDTILVTVYGLNSSGAATALELEKINYATKVMDNRQQTVERGRDAANADAVKASENRAEDFNKGYNAQSAALNNELNSRQPKPAAQGGANEIQTTGSASQPQPKKSTGGVFSGDQNTGDDF